MMIGVRRVEVYDSSGNVMRPLSVSGTPDPAATEQRRSSATLPANDRLASPEYINNNNG